MGTFIEDAIQKNNSGNHDYEDVIVKGQIIDAKELIQIAISQNKNNVTWYYVYDSYESFVSRIDNICPTPYSDTFSTYMTSASSAGFPGTGNATCCYLYDLVYHRKAGGPSYLNSFDYEYVIKEIEKELYRLGCTQVDVYLGPKTITERKPVGKPSFFSGKYKYQDVPVNVFKWMISISW